MVRIVVSVDCEDEGNNYYCYCADWEAGEESVVSKAKIRARNPNLM